MAITDFLFPQGNFLNIRSNAPNQRSYNIDATADLVRNLPGGGIRDLLAPAAAATLSLPYDAIQAATRTTQSDIDRAMQTGALTPRDIASEAFGLAYDRENPLSSAYGRFIGASAPLAERISNISNPFKMSQAAASEVDLSNRNINTTPYQDLIMNPDYMPNRLQNLERFADNRFEDSEEIPGFNFIDAPTSLKSRITNPQFLNNPNRGIIDNLILSRGNPDASLVNKTKDIGKKGFNMGKQALLSAIGFATGIPLGILGMLPEMDPRQKALREFYGYDNIGRVPEGQLMAGYNPVSGGLLNMLTGGKMGEETTYGLGRAIDKRMARIQKTLNKKKSAVLEQRLKDLQALKDREAAALKAAQNRVRLGSNLTQDKNYKSDPGLSKQGREQYTGAGMAFEKRNTGTGKGPR